MKRKPAPRKNQMFDPEHGQEHTAELLRRAEAGRGEPARKKRAAKAAQYAIGSADTWRSQGWANPPDAWKKEKHDHVWSGQADLIDALERLGETGRPVLDALDQVGDLDGWFWYVREGHGDRSYDPPYAGGFKAALLFEQSAALGGVLARGFLPYERGGGSEYVTYPALGGALWVMIPGGVSVPSWAGGDPEHDDDVRIRQAGAVVSSLESALDELQASGRTIESREQVAKAKKAAKAAKKAESEKKRAAKLRDRERAKLRKRLKREGPKLRGSKMLTGDDLKKAVASAGADPSLPWSGRLTVAADGKYVAEVLRDNPDTAERKTIKLTPSAARSGAQALGLSRSHDWQGVVKLWLLRPKKPSTAAKNPKPLHYPAAGRPTTRRLAALAEAVERARDVHEDALQHDEPQRTLDATWVRYVAASQEFNRVQRLGRRDVPVGNPDNWGAYEAAQKAYEAAVDAFRADRTATNRAAMKRAWKHTESAWDKATVHLRGLGSHVDAGGASLNPRSVVSHVPAPGRASGRQGVALCGKWAHFGTGNHDVIRRYATAKPAGYCKLCVRKLAGGPRKNEGAFPVVFKWIVQVGREVGRSRDLIAPGVEYGQNAYSEVVAIYFDAAEWTQEAAARFARNLVKQPSVKAAQLSLL